MSNKGVPLRGTDCKRADVGIGPYGTHRGWIGLVGGDLPDAPEDSHTAGDKPPPYNPAPRLDRA